MPVVVEVDLKGLEETQAAVRRVARAISGSGSSTAIGRRFAREGQRVVSQLTPRQLNRNRLRPGELGPIGTRRMKPAIWRGWQIVEKTSRANAYQAIIRNEASKNPQGLVILASLEFGADPHLIFPRNGKMLTWRERGKIVRSRGVIHPGHRAFGMVQETRDHLRRTSNLFLRSYGKQIERIFGGLNVNIR